MNVTIINLVLIPLLICMLISQRIEQLLDNSHSLWNVTYHSSAFKFDLREYSTFVTSLVCK